MIAATQFHVTWAEFVILYVGVGYCVLAVIIQSFQLDKYRKEIKKLKERK
jgi:hypothetical protein